MFRKDKNQQRGSQQGEGLIRMRSHGAGKVLTPDKTIYPESKGQPLNLNAISEAAVMECSQLSAEYTELCDNLGLSWVELDGFLKELADQARTGEIHDESLVRRLQDMVVEPLRCLLEKLCELDAIVNRKDDQQTRELMRQATMTAGSEHLSKMLTVFEAQVKSLLQLNEQDKQSQASLVTRLNQADQSARNGETIVNELFGYRTTNDRFQPGLEHVLEEKVRDAQRTLSRGSKGQVDLAALEKDWERIEEGLELYQRKKQQLAAEKAVHDEALRLYYLEVDSVRTLFDGEWHRQTQAIALMEAFFTSADLDPFALCPGLAGVRRENVFTMPDQEEREMLAGRTPQDFPKLPPTTTEDRARRATDDLERAINKASRPVQKAQPPSSSGFTGPVSLPELMLCVYASFVARYANGQPRHNSGRTVAKVYNSMMVPLGLSYGCTNIDAAVAVRMAVEKGWLRSFERKRQSQRKAQLCFQPTLEGYALTKELFEKLPKDFQERLIARHEALQAESQEWWKKIKAKEKEG